ncbi:hypothetical protein Hanom_Chr07g00607811 [Helianthus anomalus]
MSVLFLDDLRIYLLNRKIYLFRPINETNKNTNIGMLIFFYLTLTKHEHKHEHIIEHIFFVSVFSLRNRVCSCSFMFVRLKPKRTVYEHKRT